MRLGGLILTGGHSRRMGRPKEWLPFGDTTLLGHTCSVLCECTTPVGVVAREAGQVLPPLPSAAEVIHDPDPGGGPLQALGAGLRWLRERHGFTDDDAAFVAACDLPFLTAGAVRWLCARLGDAPLLMPVTEAAPQPLAAIYRTVTLPAIEALLAAGGRSPRDLGKTPGCRRVAEPELRTFDPSLRFLTNVNDPQHYERVRQRDE